MTAAGGEIAGLLLEHSATVPTWFCMRFFRFSSLAAMIMILALAFMKERSMSKNTLISAAVMASVALLPTPALAKGCIRGALAGGIAGHYAHHHAIAGAMAGCAAGHYYYKHKAAVAAKTVHG
jgi:hypothetical protein